MHTGLSLSSPLLSSRLGFAQWVPIKSVKDGTSHITDSDTKYEGFTKGFTSSLDFCPVYLVPGVVKLFFSFGIGR